MSEYSLGVKGQTRVLSPLGSVYCLMKKNKQQMSGEKWKSSLVDKFCLLPAASTFFFFWHIRSRNKKSCGPVKPLYKLVVTSHSFTATCTQLYGRKIKKNEVQHQSLTVQHTQQDMCIDVRFGFKALAVLVFGASKSFLLPPLAGCRRISMCLMLQRKWKNTEALPMISRHSDVRM